MSHTPGLPNGINKWTAIYSSEGSLTGLIDFEGHIWKYKVQIRSSDRIVGDSFAPEVKE